MKPRWHWTDGPPTERTRLWLPIQVVQQLVAAPRTGSSVSLAEFVQCIRTTVPPSEDNVQAIQDWYTASLTWQPPPPDVEVITFPTHCPVFNK